MGYAKPERLRKLFNTKAGLHAFNVLNNLGTPKWVYFKEKGQVYLSPGLEVKDGPILGSPGPGYGASVDKVAIETLKALKEDVSEKQGLRVVANAWRHETRKEFTYNPQTKRFSKYKPS